MRRDISVLLSLLLVHTCVMPLPGQTPADERLSRYFAAQTQALEGRLRQIETAEQWNQQREVYRRQLLEMLGLSPLPERTPLRAETTRTTEHDNFAVERLHFQSRPGLYVTANLYRPLTVSKPLPAILYVCGHGKVKIDGVSFGNKTHYQHHGEWFARHGYVCLTIDTLQLGEIEGVHHGTYSHDRWWWLNHGYTPAGVEAWNCIRALDYLQSREEVDDQRIGVTGRSGGGAYSWWIAAIDDRIKAAVPVAGITDLQDHVVNGCVEGHCDCMYMVNTYQWDYPLVAALVAPRPLLISNTDRDRIFPLAGVVRTHREVRRIYKLLDAEESLALHITAGPHADTQELRVHAFRWFNQHLKGDGALLSVPAEKLLAPQELKVFEELPQDEINTTIDETFVAVAPPTPTPPRDGKQWKQRVRSLRKTLRQKCFRGWPADATVVVSNSSTIQHEGLSLTRATFRSQEHVELALWILHRGEQKPELTVLNVLDQSQWDELQTTAHLLFPDAQLSGQAAEEIDETLQADATSLKKMLTAQPWAMAYLAPRGMGDDRWTGDDKKQNQLRRRFYLLGQSLDGMRVWDVLQGSKAVKSMDAFRKSSLWLQAEGSMAGLAMHAAVFRQYGRVDLHQPPSSYRAGPTLLNVRRFTTLPEVAAMAVGKSPLVIYTDSPDDWSYLTATAKQLNWDKRQFQIRKAQE